MESLNVAPKQRSYVSGSLTIKGFNDIKSYYEELKNRPIKSAKELRQWFNDKSELDAIVSEDLAWRYIRMTCDTSNEDHKNAYTEFITNIEPEIAPFRDLLNKKAMASEFINEFQDSAFYILKRSLENEIKLFREENIPLYTEIQNLSKEFSAVSGSQSVVIDNEEMTMQQAAVILQSTDREKRENAWNTIAERRFADREKLDSIYSQQIKLRHQVALNAGFENFRDFMFSAMGRFDYKPKDCFQFHESVKKEIVPLLKHIAEERKSLMHLDKLKPWDKSVDPEGKEALKPFSNVNELVEKTISCFSSLDPFLGKCIATLKDIKHLDLDSRKGKAPGGYNYPLAETGIPFIFMNATSTLRDLVTIIHEGGHAVHSIVTKDLELRDFKDTPSEVAELASMSMELLSLNSWDLFFKSNDDYKRAVKEHLFQIIETLPWVATIDKFQHWVYENPAHSSEERQEMWLSILDEFSDGITDWEGNEKYKRFLWQRQLHLFEVPFYYIEYGFAQLGALAVWKNQNDNATLALDNYLKALKLGYTESIPKIYETAGIQFNFSQEYIRDLFEFVKVKLDELD